MTETSLQARVLKALGSQPNIRLFRNQVGFGYMGHLRTSRGDTFVLDHARPVTFGLHPGSSDLIGWQQIEITPDMVGRRFAIFMGVEVKTEAGRERPNQRNWRTVVNNHGGIAIVARTDEVQKLKFQIQEIVYG